MYTYIYSPSPPYFDFPKVPPYRRTVCTANLPLSLALPMIRFTSKMKNNRDLFCILLGFHYLCT